MHGQCRRRIHKLAQDGGMFPLPPERPYSALLPQEEHRQMVNRVLERLAKLDLYLKPGKCQFEVKRIEFLGVILEDGTVTMDPIKIAGMKDWKTPRNVKEVRQVLGFWNFYR